MPFNPNVPVNGTKVDADELRTQFNGLKTLIDAVPAPIPGPPGPQGEQGPQGALQEGDNAFSYLQLLVSTQLELTAGNKFFIHGLPTEDPQEGDRLWNDGGVLKISAGSP